MYTVRVVGVRFSAIMSSKFPHVVTTSNIIFVVFIDGDGDVGTENIVLHQLY